MAKPFPLQPLMNLAQQKNDTAKRKLGQLNQQQQSAQAKLDTLLQFRKDYQEKFQEAARNGMAPIDLRNFQDFIYRLDEAIRQQRSVIEQAQRSVQHGREELNTSRRNLKSFDTLAQRHHQNELERETRNEQKQMDEHASRMAAYRNTRSTEEH